MDHNMKTPLVTVLMPVHNGETYLRSAIESILSQTFSNFEFLIINDGSSDKSVDIIESYKDERIRLIHNESNLGLPATLNKGIDLTQGKYIARMDCDDVSLPNRLKKQVSYMQAHPEIGILGTNCQMIGPQDQPGKHSDYPTKHGFIRWRLAFGSFLAHPTVMMRTDILRRLGGYRMLDVAQDYDLWQRAAWETRLACLPQPLLKLRYNPSSSSRTKQEQVYINSNAITQTVMGRMLGNPPPLELAAQIRTWRFDSTIEAQRAAKLIAQLCRANLADPTLNQQERQLIRTDAAKWLLHIARQYHTWAILPLALQIDPLFPLRLPFIILHRSLTA